MSPAATSWISSMRTRGGRSERRRSASSTFCSAWFGCLLAFASVFSRPGAVLDEERVARGEQIEG